MPNKTIYVADGDLALFNRAQELAGGNLSQAISQAIRRYVEVREARMEGLKEITVKVGLGALRRQKRFVGVKIAKWRHQPEGGRFESFTVYRTQKEKFAVEIRRGGDVSRIDWSQAVNWEDDFDPIEESKETTLEVYDTLDQLKANVPPELGSIVERSHAEPEVEDLDI
jgi:EXLDI family protein